MTLTELMELFKEYNARNNTPLADLRLYDDTSGAIYDGGEYITEFRSLEELISLLRGEKTSHESMQ